MSRSRGAPWMAPTCRYAPRGLDGALELQARLQYPGREPSRELLDHQLGGLVGQADPYDPRRGRGHDASSHGTFEGRVGDVENALRPRAFHEERLESRRGATIVPRP